MKNIIKVRLDFSILQQKIKMQTTIDETIFMLPCEQFYFTIASNHILLQKGYQIVYKYLSLSPINREQTLLHLLSQKSPVLTLVTRVYPVVYSDQSIGITQQQKLKTKQFIILQVLLKRLVCNYGKQTYANKKNLTNILNFLMHFHNNEGFEGWVKFYQKLLEELINMNSQLVGFILIQILKSSDDRVSCFSKHIISLVINNQGVIKINEEDSLQVLYYCVKSMSYMNGTQDEVLEQYFQPYEQKILQYIYESMQKSIKIMKYSLKILTVFVGQYEIQLQKELVNKIRLCSKQLICEFIKTRLIKQTNSDNLQQDDEQNNPTLSIIIYQQIQLLETLLSNEQLKINDYQLYLSVALPSLLPNISQYNEYTDSTQTYLADIEDQGQKTLRNKAISFLLQLYEGQYPPKSKSKMTAQILKYSTILQSRSLGDQKFIQQIIQFFKNISLPIQLQKQHIPLFQQSLTFLLYHLTQQILTSDSKNLQQNKQLFIMNLGKNIQLSNLSNNPLLKLSYLNLLNKTIKSMNKNVKQAYYGFLLECTSKINDYQSSKGFLLSICRGLAYVSNDVTINVVQVPNSQKGINFIVIQNLIKYLIDNNTLQESAHLILQFLLTLIRKDNNFGDNLKISISSQVKIHILTTYIHDGTIADVVIDLISEISTQQFAKYIYGQFSKGSTKEQNLVTLISRWINLQILKTGQDDIKSLLKVYQSNFISKIIKQYLCVIQNKKRVQQLSQQLISILNDRIHSSWILPMISCNILRNPELLLINTVQKITYELTSQYEIQNQLLLPYYTFINDPRLGVNILRSKSIQLYEDFIHKLLRYASLFQGSNLKVITSNVLLNICEIDNSKIKQVLQLIQSYGKSIQTQEWEDQNQKDQQAVIDRMFNMKLINDQIEKQFSLIFTNIVYDMALVHSKVQKLTTIFKI